MYKLYVIPTHACRSAILMLDHKQVPYRRIDLISVTHPVIARLHGFDAGGQHRSVGGRRTLGIRVGDALATVPALAAGTERISTNHAIARYLDAHHPDRPLLPADPKARAAVEAAERWGNEVLQMDARRILGGAMLRDPAGINRRLGSGRLGHLVYRHALARRLGFSLLLRHFFVISPDAERELLAALPGQLDLIDRWIADGVIGQEQLNVADCMIAPSLAMILYRPDVRSLFAGRPALEFVDRLLPEPGAVS